jgi:NADH:ubiquinone oxidoreductase subunit 4 (subunit M)
MAVPGSLNWVSEILCLTGTYEISPFAGILGASSVLLGAIYTVWLYVSITGGSPSPYLALTNDMTLRERTLLLMLIIPTFILGIYPNFVMDTIHIFVTGLVNTPISICSFVLFFLKIKKEDT